MKNYYRITINLNVLDDYLLTDEEAKKIGMNLKKFIDDQFGFDENYPDWGEVISIEIDGTRYE